MFRYCQRFITSLNESCLADVIEIDTGLVYLFVKLVRVIFNENSFTKHLGWYVQAGAII